MFSGNEFAHYWPAYPALVPALWGLLLLFFVPLLKNDKRWLWGFSVAGMTSCLAVCAIMLSDIAKRGLATHSLGVGSEMMVRVDVFGLWLALIFAGSGLMALLLMPQYLDRARSHHAEVYPLLFLAVSGMALMVGTESLMMIFIGLEVLSISLYVLCGLMRERSASIESALKYFLLGAFSTGFLVYGTALVLGATGSMHLPKIAEALRLGGDSINQPLLLAGIAMILIALAFKAAAVPFHFWLPDVYQGAPTPITAFMAAGTKAAAFGVLIRILHTGFSTGAPDDLISARWLAVLGLLAAATMLVGNLVALVQTRVKRLLAYSSVANAGYLLLALMAPLEIGTSNIVFFLVTYSFMTIGAFAVVSLFQEGGDDADHIDNFKGLWHRRPVLASCMLLLLVSLIGIPPTGGFMGKWLIFVSAWQSGHGTLAVIMALSAVIGAAYYLRVIVAMFVEDPTSDMSNAIQIPVPVALVVAISCGATLLLGLVPTLLTEPLDYLHQSLIPLS
jgi:NADH-quinone oxidoreductase subunit N